MAARRGELLDVLGRHGVTNPEIFGSTARGDDRECSDLDLLVDFAPGTDNIDIIGIKRERPAMPRLSGRLAQGVDVVPLPEWTAGGDEALMTNLTETVSSDTITVWL